MIGLHLEPKSADGLEDLRGRAAFADVWLGRLPRIALATGRASNLFGEKEEVHCPPRLRPAARGESILVLQLDDVLGQCVAEVERPVQPAGDRRPRRCGNPPCPGRASIGFGRGSRDPPTLPSKAWRWPSSSPWPTGRQSVRLGPAARRSSLGVGHRSCCVRRGRMGQVAGVVCSGRVRKGPGPGIALGRATRGRRRPTRRRTGHPPAEVRKRLPSPKTVTAADVFGSAPENWLPQLEPIIARLCAQLRWWQLGEIAT